jgi:uncharacterized membrane protein YdjX (TVP38/TMEM64 family)
MERRKLIAVLGVTAVLVVVFALLRRSMGLEFDPESLRAAVGALGVWAPLAYVGVVAFRVPLGLPSQIVLVGGGLLFGTRAGTLYGALGLALSAVLLFLSARWAGRETLERRLPDSMRSLLEVAGSRVGAVFIAVGTGYPLGPITMYHLLAGVTDMALFTFVVAATLGSIVRSATFTYFGSSLLAGDATGVLKAAGLLLLVLLVPLLVPGSRSWLMQTIWRRGEPR